MMLFKAFSKSLLILALLTVNAMGNEETPTFNLIEKEGQFELRHYPEMVVAKVVSQESDNAMFRKLAGYIFGGNETESQIKMTAPVFMQSKSGQNTMMFYMPSKYSLDTLPEPNSQEVELGTISFGKVAVIKYSGFNPMRKRKANFEKLMNWIEKKGLEIYDNEFYSAGYDSPWTLPWKRKNEVMVLVK
ncbi:MAG: heme-binding protein [Bdellovibrionota bacterium]|nr:heme-binding protein [Bdellovibrionota bacterium]